MDIRTAICILAGMLALLFLFMLTPKHLLLPKGIALPAQTVRASITPDQVTIYHQAPHVNFTRLGDVRVELGFRLLNAQTKDLLLEKVKTLAASLGANGVIVNFAEPYNGIRPIFPFYGTAIYVPPRKT